MQGKFIPFIVGCIAGVAGLYAFIDNRQIDAAAPVDLAGLSSQVVPVEPEVRSPLSVVPEEPVVESVVQIESSPGAERIDELESRLSDAESRIESLELVLANVSSPIAESEPASEPDLLSAGFDPFVVSEIETIRNDLQLQRLELRDRATREGWVSSDEFRQAFRELNGGSRLRETLGDEDYDRLLLAEGRDNRIRIDSVIDNSAANSAGIQDGDVIYRYADDRIFTFRDLRSATAAGEKDEPVTVQVLRDGTLVDLVIPRGPLGVTISPVTDDGSE